MWGASPALLGLASDARLVSLLRAGRDGAFEAIYDRHHRGILAFCAHLLGDRHEAEDAVQHTFMSAYNALLAGGQEIQLRPWLYTIARNRCFSVLRARREIAVAEVQDGVDDGPATVVQRREELRDLVADVSRLPADQRAALVMAELSALSHEEIAVALDVPREKVKALVFQARESLVATRTARETDCSEIRVELSNLRGPALRRRHLRRHLHECPGCRQYRSELRRQHGRLAAVLPIAPSWALKGAVLRSTVGGRAAAAAGAGGTVASSALKAGAVKAILGTVAAVLSAAGAVVVVHRVVARVQAHPVVLHLPAPAAPLRRTTIGAAPLRESSRRVRAPHTAATAAAVRRTVSTRPAQTIGTRIPASRGTTTARHTAGSAGPLQVTASAPTAGTGAGVTISRPPERTNRVPAPTRDHGTPEAPPVTGPTVGTGGDTGVGAPGDGDHPATGDGHDPGSTGDGGSTGAGGGTGDGGSTPARPAGALGDAGSTPDNGPTGGTAAVNSPAGITSQPAVRAARVASPSRTAVLSSSAGPDQYRSGTTSTRRTAQWPKLQGRSPAKSSQSPAVPVASGVRPPLR
jgi:RNA polymerase sigma factor (sigma-70 family)